MKKIFGLILVWLLLAGCALGKTVATRFDVSASGGPAVIAGIFSGEHIRTTPGGFTALGVELERNSQNLFGVMSNENSGEEKDVFIYVRRQGKWAPYLGVSEVKTEGYIAVDGGEKMKLSSPIFQVERLEALHFGTASLQSVTLRVRRDSGEVSEIVFDTGGGRLIGNHYYRANDLFIRLPEGDYKLMVYSYSGYGVFRRMTRVPSEQYVAVRSGTRSYQQLGNALASWVVRL
ncbi:MAG: hypothetical protein AAB378_02535 [Patescibacteria group bacterium]